LYVFFYASITAAKDLQNLLIKPIQRDIKRTVEEAIFVPAIRKTGFDPVRAKVRLNWGTGDSPEFLIDNLISAAEKGLIRADEFRKNAVRFGWQLWEDKTQGDNKAVGGG